ncbi:nucleoside deaminase [Chitinispirillales bacterium ANBcel5]|uniref:nucleoside deaminase n=1 Tax=Cellulosispirillum alkaliphilum TaxID=3039283 RepID=UPI002A4F460D|nr:nucleoside deaminase [Chitinispirillales bacterium ANBcel5]
MNTQLSTTVTITIPEWIEPFLNHDCKVLNTVEQKMALVLKIANRNIEAKSGGPFAAAVFNLDTDEIISVGVNLVTTSGLSITHAEMVALMLAQKKMGTFDLGAKGLPPCQLVSSTAPCAMCLGAIPWSGIKSLVCGARDEDARSVGFDEGAKPVRWIDELNLRGIEVKADVLREEAKAVLQHYREMGGIIYNGHQNR